MNELYADFAGESGDVMSSVVVQLSNPNPYDLSEVNVAEYKGIIPPWSDWNAVVEQGRSLAVEVLGGSNQDECDSRDPT
jgi:hypothetical protein